MAMQRCRMGVRRVLVCGGSVAYRGSVCQCHRNVRGCLRSSAERAVCLPQNSRRSRDILLPPLRYNLVKIRCYPVGYFDAVHACSESHVRWQRRHEMFYRKRLDKELTVNHKASTLKIYSLQDSTPPTSTAQIHVYSPIVDTEKYYTHHSNHDASNDQHAMQMHRHHPLL